MSKSSANIVTKNQRGRPRVPWETRARILNLASNPYLSMKEIEKKLVAEDRAVSYTTIRDIVAREFPHDPSARWRLEAALGLHQGHPDQVFDVLAGVLAVTGSPPEITTRMADWVVALRLAVPTLAPWVCYVLARRYVTFEIQKRDSQELDLLLLHVKQPRSLDTPTVDSEMSALLRQLVTHGFAHHAGGEIKVVEPSPSAIKQEQPRRDSRTVNISNEADDGAQD